MTRCRYLLVALLAASGCIDAASDMAEPGAQGGGKSDNPACARGEAGTLDTCAGFGHAALSNTTISWQRAVMQADGKLLVFGLRQTWSGEHPGQYAPFLVRLLANGTLDDSFAAELPPNQSLENHFTPYAVAVRPDGTILVGGSMSRYNDYNWSLAIQTLHPDGSADTTAPSVTLPVRSDVNAQPEKLLLQPDGSYYIVGTLQNPRNYVSSWRAAFAARVGVDGLLDKTWGTNGMTEVPDNDYTSAFDAAAVEDALYVVGSQTSYSTRATLVTKLDAHGAVDSSFPQFRTTDGEPTAFVAREDGSLSIATAASYTRLDISPTGELIARARYAQGTGLSYPELAELSRSGTMLSMVRSFVTATFAQYNADGTVDDAFHRDPIEFPWAVDGHISLDLDHGSTIETSSEWILVGHRRAGDDESDIVTMRLWK